MRGGIAAVLLMAFAMASVHAAAAAQGGSFPAYRNFSQELNLTYSYVNSVNDSSYLIFYPNLTAAYHYMSLASNAPDQGSAYALLNEARSSAMAQQIKINGYKEASAYVLAASTIGLVALLALLMRRMPSRRTSGRK